MRRLFTLMVVMLLLTVGSAALAQEAPPVFCGSLAQADCDLLNQARAAGENLDSGTVSFNFNLNISGVPDLPDNANINVTGTGAFFGAGSFKQFSAMSADAAAADIGAMFPSLLDALENFSGDLSLTITIPPELAEGGPSSVPLNLRIVNGVGYIDFDALQPITEDPSLTGWGGLDFVSLFRDLLAQQPDLFDELTEMSGTSMTMGMDPDIMARFSDPAFAEQFLNIQRVADENGNAVFETNFDFNQLFSDPEFQQYLRDQMQQQAAEQGEEMTEAEINQAIEITSTMFENSTFVIREAIDPATGFTRSTSGSMMFDMSSLAAMAEEQGESMDATPIINIDFNVSMDNLNSTAAINAPENASLFPYQMLLGMAGSMQEMPMDEVTPEVGD